jgi:hypothetical protein
MPAKDSSETRAEIAGLFPVAGRPLFLSTDIALFIIVVYTKSKPRGSVNFRPGSNSSHEDSNQWLKLIPIIA